MTVSELYGQVSGLGFETSLEDNDVFYFAANRALLQVGAIRPAICTCPIHHSPMENLLDDTFEPIEKKHELTFEATGAKAYYFECDGSGAVYIARLALSAEWEIIGTRELASARTFVPYKGVIRADGAFTYDRVRLRFVGEYLYSVRNVALYPYVYSENTEDVPAFGAYTAYDISALADDFLSLEAPPIREEDVFVRMSSDYEVEDGRILLLPHSVRGVFRVLYRHKPRALENTGEPAEDTTVIDLDEELCSLLPLLVGAYVWAEDEKELASYYMTLYQSRAAEIQARVKNMKPVIIKNKLGW
jgi:hypothetical protein